MAGTTIHELIGTWYGRGEEEFIADLPDPVLVGIGRVDASIIRAARDSGTTWCLAFPHAAARARPVEEPTGPDPLVGVVLPLLGKQGPGQTQIIVGRSPFCDIVLPHQAISELHCQVERRSGTYTISDQGSTNGTMINGFPLPESESHVLRDEDVVTIGQHSFQFFTPHVLFKYLQLGPGR